MGYDKKKFPKLGKGDQANFETMQKAFVNNDVCLMRAVRKSDNKPVALVCAVNWEVEDGVKFFSPAPLAVMVEGNPYELFEPIPTKEDENDVKDEARTAAEKAERQEESHTDPAKG